KYELEHRIVEGFKGKIGITVNAKPVTIGDLPRSEKKSTRVYDNRY
ncbi:MAG: phenylacetate--CoA ligase family protein, partial [Clostridia bacterium]